MLITEFDFLNMLSSGEKIAMEGEVKMVVMAVGIGRKQADQDEASGTIGSCKEVRGGRRR